MQNNNDFVDQSNQSAKAYSCYFEFQLDESDFGQSRDIHNKLCNEQLIEHLKVLDGEGISLSPKISNQALIESINAKKNRSPGKELFTWEHCPSITANGRLGVMRLVSYEQHSKSADNPFDGRATS